MGKKKGAGTKGGGKNSIMNGRALFQYNPDLFKDDDNANIDDTGPTEAKDEEEKEQADEGDDDGQQIEEEQENGEKIKEKEKPAPEDDPEA